MPELTNPWYEYITRYKYLAFMETPVKMIHAGYTFYGGHVFKDVAASASGEFVVDVGNDPAHVKGSVTHGGDCIVEVFEDNDISDNGTSVNVVNKNRNSDLTNGVSMYHTPTVNSYGSSITPDNGTFSAGGSGFLTLVGGIFEDSHNIFKPNTNYILRATNESSSTIHIGVAIEYFTTPE